MRGLFGGVRMASRAFDVVFLVLWPVTKLRRVYAKKSAGQEVEG